VAGQTDSTQQKNLNQNKSAMIVDYKILEKQQKLRNQIMELSNLQNPRAIGRKDKRQNQLRAKGASARG